MSTFNGNAVEDRRLAETDLQMSKETSLAFLFVISSIPHGSSACPSRVFRGLAQLRFRSEYFWQLSWIFYWHQI